MSVAILNNGIYSFGEAARLLASTLPDARTVSPSRVRAWFRGWPRFSPAVTHSDYEDVPSRCGIVSFLDLIEALVVLQLRREGISLQYLRKVNDALASEFEIDHPFGRKKIFTDGHHIFIETADAAGDVEMIELVTRLLRQHTIPPVLRPYLRQIEYDPVTLLASQWNVHAGVVVDPRRSYGKPIVNAVGIPTAILSAAYSANAENARIVAEWYDIRPRHVMTAVQFERHLSRTAA